MISIYALIICIIFILIILKVSFPIVFPLLAYYMRTPSLSRDELKKAKKNIISLLRDDPGLAIITLVDPRYDSILQELAKRKKHNKALVDLSNTTLKERLRRLTTMNIMRKHGLEDNDENFARYASGLRAPDGVIDHLTHKDTLLIGPSEREKILDMVRKDYYTERIERLKRPPPPPPPPPLPRGSHSRKSSFSVRERLKAGIKG